MNDVRGFFLFGGVRFWYGCPIRLAIGNAVKTVEINKIRWVTKSSSSSSSFKKLKRKQTNDTYRNNKHERREKNVDQSMLSYEQSKYARTIARRTLTNILFFFFFLGGRFNCVARLTQVTHLNLMLYGTFLPLNTSDIWNVFVCVCVCLSTRGTIYITFPQTHINHYYHYREKEKSDTDSVNTNQKLWKQQITSLFSNNN